MNANIAFLIVGLSGCMLAVMATIFPSRGAFLSAMGLMFVSGVVLFGSPS